MFSDFTSKSRNWTQFIDCAHDGPKYIAAREEHTDRYADRETDGQTDRQTDLAYVGADEIANELFHVVVDGSSFLHGGDDR